MLNRRSAAAEGLVEAVGDGVADPFADKRANLDVFIEVAQRRRAQLLWVAQRIMRDSEEAEDIVQEALLRAYRSFDGFRGEAQVSTWLRVIVQNTAREWLRNRRGIVCLSLEGPDEDEPTVSYIADPGLSPEQQCQRREMEEILYAEIEQLGQLCRRAIQMCAIEEQSLREAALLLNTSVVSLKSRIFRGKQLLKREVSRRMGEASQALTV